VQLPVSAWSSKLVFIRFIILGILRFLYFAVFAWNCLFTPIFGKFWRHICPPNIVIIPKRTILVRKHVLWAINRENRSSGSTWAWDREKKGKDMTAQHNQKSHKVVIFRLFGKKPPLYRLKPKYAWRVNSSPRRRNHVCKVSIFPFSNWFLHGPYNSAALMRCLRCYWKVV